MDSPALQNGNSCRHYSSAFFHGNQQRFCYDWKINHIQPLHTPCHRDQRAASPSSFNLGTNSGMEPIYSFSWLSNTIDIHNGGTSSSMPNSRIAQSFVSSGVDRLVKSRSQSINCHSTVRAGGQALNISQHPLHSASSQPTKVLPLLFVWLHCC